MGDKHYPEAEQMLRKSIELEPSYGAHANLGYLYTQEQKFAEAAAATEKALQMNDKDYVVWGNLAIAYEGLQRQRKNEQSVGPRNRSSRTDRARHAPRCHRPVESRAGLLAKKKLRDKAVSRIQSALALSPTIPTFWRSSA